MKLFKTISVAALILLVLISSSNFMIGIHYCSGEVANIGFFSDAASCEMERKLPPCHRHLTAPCCEDETIIHQGEELKNTGSQTHAPQPFAFEMVTYGTLVSEIIPSAPTPRAAFTGYDPPRTPEDITITTRVFRI